MGFFGDKRHRQNAPRTIEDSPLAADVLPSYMTGVPVPAEEQGVSLSKAAKISLDKFTNLRRQWAVYKASDLSFSMQKYLADGSLDYLTEAILQVMWEHGWDADNKVPAFPYGRNVAQEPYEILLGQHNGASQRLIEHADSQRVDRGGTNFAPAAHAIMEHYRNSEDWGKHGAIVFFQTDGLNYDMDQLIKVLTLASEFPMHWVFIYYGDVDPSGWGSDNAANLRKLDDGRIMPNRRLDNVSMFIAGPEPKRVTPMELYRGLLTGPNKWVTEANFAGVHIP